MTTEAVSTSPARIPDPAEVFAFADEEITTAATELWPQAHFELGDQVPSVTGYVRRIRVDSRPLYAKYSFLGVSLVSLLRGTCGPWPDVRYEQQAYLQRPDALMEREAAQLRLLARLGHPRVCAVAGLKRGVLFTESVTGQSLADLLPGHPAETAELLGAAFGQLHGLHQPPTARGLGPAGAIGERSIAGTFQRKFNGLSGPTYLRRLGTDRCAAADREEVADVLGWVVARLHRLRATMLPQPTRRTVAYGDLKPEHVFFPDGPTGQPVFIDPGLQIADPALDAAKLISRTALVLAAARPGPLVGQHLVHGIDVFASKRMDALPDTERRAWRSRVLVLWLMDSINILSTYLSAPAALPLPDHGTALVARAVDWCRAADRTSSELAAGTAPHAVWDNALVRLQAVAA
ncbi:phosphotransferase [Streptomyces smyrnaeus]|uniref:phosphotransferase n=1 Tax=Streptomyces smyrnaeus TaxID=1387713 RepID=UPI0027DE3AB8|nr:phosphotransferase [Streptomyces smyrnaeus]